MKDKNIWREKVAWVGWTSYTGLTSCITSRDFKVCDQGVYTSPDFIKDYFLIGYNIFQLIVSKQIVNTNCIKWT